MRKTVSVDILRNQSLSYDLGCTVRQSLPDNIQSAVLVKAPNDLLIYNKKFAGILVESITYGQKVDLVIGVGINVFIDNDIDIIRQPYTGLKHYFPGLNKQVLFNETINGLLNYLYD